MMEINVTSDTTSPFRGIIRTLDEKLWMEICQKWLNICQKGNKGEKGRVIGRNNLENQGKTCKN